MPAQPKVTLKTYFETDDIPTEAQFADLIDSFQNIDVELTALASVTSGPNTLPFFTGIGTAELTSLTAAGRALLDDADAVAQRATLGLTIGTNVQAYDAELAALAGLVSSVDTLPYFTGPATAGLTSITAAGRALLDDADAVAQRATLGLTIGTNVQAYDAELAAIAGLTSSANTLPYFTGSGVASLTSLTAAGRALLDDADAVAQRATLGLVIGTNVQAYDAELAALAGLVSSVDTLPYFTGAGTAELTSLTAAGRALLDDADATAQRATLGLGSAATAEGSAFATSAQGLLADTAVQPGALGSLASLNTVNDTNWSGSDLAIVNGGTGASTAAAARTALGAIGSDPTGITGADVVTNIVSLTQAEYDAIGAPSATTFYIITDAI